MPHFKFDVTETTTQTVHYVVEAHTEAAAKKKAMIGETVKETTMREHGVCSRDIYTSLGPCDKNGEQ